MKQFKGSKIEIQQLKEKISNMNKKEKDYKGTYYHPEKMDYLDTKLAEFINSYSDLAVNFIREQEGVYMFGSKRIYIKTD